MKKLAPSATADPQALLEKLFALLLGCAFQSCYAVRLSNISRRQLIYWTSQGYIGCKDHKRWHTFTLMEILKIYMIKMGLDAGLSLRSAAEAASAYHTFFFQNGPQSEKPYSAFASVGGASIMELFKFQIVENLKLTAGMIKNLGFASYRQVQYWNDIGLVCGSKLSYDKPERPKSPRSYYDFHNIFKIYLMGRSNFDNPRKAAPIAESIVNEAEKILVLRQQTIEALRSACHSQNSQNPSPTNINVGEQLEAYLAKVILANIKIAEQAIIIACFSSCNDPITTFFKKSEIQVMVTTVLDSMTKARIFTYSEADKAYSLNLDGSVTKEKLAESQVVLATYFIAALISSGQISLITNDTISSLVAKGCEAMVKYKLLLDFSGRYRLQPFIANEIRRCKNEVGPDKLSECLVELIKEIFCLHHRAMVQSPVYKPVPHPQEIPAKPFATAVAPPTTVAPVKETEGDCLSVIKKFMQAPDQDYPACGLESIKARLQTVIDQSERIISLCEERSDEAVSMLLLIEEFESNTPRKGFEHRPLKNFSRIPYQNLARNIRAQIVQLKGEAVAACDNGASRKLNNAIDDQIILLEELLEAVNYCYQQ